MKGEIKWSSHSQLHKPFVPYFSCPSGKKISLILCNCSLWHVADCVFWKTDSKAKVCIQNVNQGLTLVGKKGSRIFQREK